MMKPSFSRKPAAPAPAEAPLPGPLRSGEVEALAVCSVLDPGYSLETPNEALFW